MLLLWGQQPLSVLSIAYRIWASVRMLQLEGWFQSWVPDSVQGVVAVLLRLGILLFLILRRCFLGLLTRILDKVSSSLGLPGWFRHAYFEYHSHARLRFKLGCWAGSTLDWGRWYPTRVPSECEVYCRIVLALV